MKTSKVKIAVQKALKVDSSAITSTAYEFGKGRISLGKLAFQMQNLWSGFKDSTLRDMPNEVKMPLRAGFILSYVENIKPEIDKVPSGVEKKLLSRAEVLESGIDDLKTKYPSADLAYIKTLRADVSTYISGAVRDMRNALASGSNTPRARGKNLKFFEWIFQTLNETAKKRCKNAVNKTSDLDSTAHQDAHTLASKAYIETYRRVAKIK
jgi:hypothetical protein